MSTVSPPDAVTDSTVESVPESQPSFSSDDTFDYQPMPVLVPLAMVLAIGGLTGLLGAFGILLGLVAIPVSILAWLKVRNSDGFYSGGTLAKTALGLAVVGVVAGVALQRHAYRNEVPDGARRLSFKYDISDEPLGETFDGVAVSDAIRELDGQTVFLKGYMYPQKSTENLPSFLLLKDTGECCFGGEPAIQDMIGVKMSGDLLANHHEQVLVAVAGTFKVNENYGRTGAQKLEPLYQIEATHFEPARTIF